MSDIHQLRADYLGILERLQGVAGSGYRERLEAIGARIRTDRLRILVVGEFSRGKSTFLNALMGRPVLPAAVNPTTAVINVINGGPDLSGEIEYADGRVQAVELPAEKTNKALKAVVTVANSGAEGIRAVRLRVPGRLEQLQAELVDTPGVNDLDATREDVTFGYLKEADAIILLLDAHQPLSTSEAAFLGERVLKADIRRIFFVLNKIDEAAAEKIDPDALARNIQRRLGTDLGIEGARVYPLSARETLRARHTGAGNCFEEGFDRFEQALLEFAARQAGAGRFQLHHERMEQVVADLQAGFENRWNALDLEAEAARDQAALFAEKEMQVEAEIGRIADERQRIEGPLNKALGRSAAEAAERLRAAVAGEIGACESAEALQSARHALNRRVREFVEGLNRDAERFSAEERERLESEFKPVLARTTGLIVNIKSPFASRDMQHEIDAVLGGSAMASFSSVGAGGGFGGGFGGILGSIFKAVFSGTSLVDTLTRVLGGVLGAATPDLAPQKAKVEAELAKALERITARLDETCRKVSAEVAAALVESLQERAREQLRLIRASHESLRQVQAYSDAERQRGKLEIEARIKTLISIRQALNGLRVSRI